MKVTIEVHGIKRMVEVPERNHNYWFSLAGRALATELEDLLDSTVQQPCNCPDCILSRRVVQ